jgi:hypothetical protein
MKPSSIYLNKIPKPPRGYTAIVTLFSKEFKLRAIRAGHPDMRLDCVDGKLKWNVEVDNEA